MHKTKSTIIVALDYAHIDPLKQLVDQLSPELCRVKIGNILFTRYGPSLVERLMRQGFDVFLDLKFHDIPQTVAGACRSAAELGVWMVNLHIAGGAAMMSAAREMTDSFKIRPLLMGVTVLTSLVEADLQPLGMRADVSDVVLNMAKLAKTQGLDGVVCSPQEVRLLRFELGNDFLLVTPGIRSREEQGLDDQKRTMTPEAAVAAGANYLVVGRPITQSAPPAQALRSLNQALQKLK